MVKTTRAQREAIKCIYDRRPLFPYISAEEFDAGVKPVPLSYKQFRRGVVRYVHDAVMVQWCGVWLCIEPDGHTHS